MLKIFHQNLGGSSFRVDTWFDGSSGILPTNQRAARAEQPFPSAEVIRVDLQQGPCLISGLFAG